MANNPYSDLFKSLGDWGVPNWDYKDGLGSSRKQVEAFVAAGQVAAEATQAIIRKNVDIARGTAQEAMELWKDLSSSKSVEASAAKQAEFAKNTIEKGLNNSREILEIASQSGSEAYEILSKQAQQAAGEFVKPKKKAS